MIGYNAFYVPDAPLSEPTAAADTVSSGGSVSREAPASETGLNSFLPGMEKASSFSGVSAGSEKNASSGSRRPSGSRKKVSRSGSKRLGHKININTATAQELSEGLDGIGDGLAERIVAYRRQHGSFQSVDQIKNVSGIGDKRYEKIRDFITVQ
ncbi:MAG: helix-hairpin-helix domain-containing protein [Oscillospiraceae bacterium]|nr:helix-hairpin-helix domain-containing protein [Oscillospiraceae bacterium]